MSTTNTDRDMNFFGIVASQKLSDALNVITLACTGTVDLLEISKVLH
jgi:hypothetical protein